MKPPLWFARRFAGLTILSVLLLLSTFHSEFVLVHYGALILGVYSISYLLLGKVPSLADSRWRWAIPAIVAIAAALIWWRNDYYYRIWSPNELPSGYESMFYHDYIARGKTNYEPYYREMHYSRKDKSIGNIVGGFTESGKRHGKWTTWSSYYSKSETKTNWYWNGEEISEGEWNLRNR
jgi:hypothetical protein